MRNCCVLWRRYRSSASRRRHGREIVLWKVTRNRYFFGRNIPLALLPVAAVSVSSVQMICFNKVYKPSLALLNRFLSRERRFFSRTSCPIIPSKAPRPRTLITPVWHGRCADLHPVTVGVYRQWFSLLYVLSLRQCWISYSGGSNADDLCASRPRSNTVRRSQLCKFIYACFTITLFVFETST